MPSKMPIYLAAEHCSGEPMSLGILLHELFKRERELDDDFLLLLPLRHFPLSLPFTYPLISSIPYSFLPFPSCFHHATSPIPLLSLPFSSLLEEQYNLSTHLRSLRRFFLLEHGDFFIQVRTRMRMRMRMRARMMCTGSPISIY